jgi:hypothetical protein
VRTNLAPADLDQALAKIDLQLLAGRRLKPHRRPRLRGKLLGILHRPLNRAQADEDALLASSWRMTSMAAQPFPQPRLQAIERPLAPRLPIRRPAAGRDVVPRRVAADPELPGNPFGAPPQPVQPEYRRNLFRLQHRLPPRILDPQRG